MSHHSLSNLLCGEDFAGLLGDDEPPEDVVVLAADVDELIAAMVVEERDYCPSSEYRTKLSTGLLQAREEAIAWTLKVHGYYHFRPMTAYLSVNYIDRFLASHTLPQATNGWPIELLSVTSLSVAAKMEETIIPSLLDLQLKGSKFIFEPRTIRRMEVLVLNALNWRLRSVTPFDFIDFFAFKINPSGVCSRYLVSRATEIILSTIHETKFLDQWPSTVAAAAIICAADSLPNLSLVSPQDAVPWCVGLNKDKIVSCYKLVQELVLSSSNESVSKYNKVAKVVPQIRLTAIDKTQVLGSGDSSNNTSGCASYKRRKLNNSLWMCDNKNGDDKNIGDGEDEQPLKKESEEKK